MKAGIYPDSLNYTVKTTSQVLHRSIYDVPVYTAELTIKGNFVLDNRQPGVKVAEVVLNMDDLKGIQGNPTFSIGNKEFKVKSGEKGLKAELVLDDNAKESDALPFSVRVDFSLSRSPSTARRSGQTSMAYSLSSWCSSQVSW